MWNGSNLCAERRSPPSASRERGLPGLYQPDLARGPFGSEKSRVLIYRRMAHYEVGFVVRDDSHGKQGGRK